MSRTAIIFTSLYFISNFFVVTCAKIENPVLPHSGFGRNGSFIKDFNRFKSNKIFCFTNRIFQKAISQLTAMRSSYCKVAVT